MNMKDFEGFKKIPNEKNLTAEDVQKVLLDFKTELGTVDLVSENMVVCDVPGKYKIDISVTNNFIIVKREIEEGKLDESDDSGNVLKTRDFVDANRMVDQIYDLLVEFITKNTTRERITAPKAVYYMTEHDSTINAFGKEIPGFSSIYDVYTDTNRLLYTFKKSLIGKTYNLHNEEQNKDEIVINYTGAEKNEYTLLIYPYTTLVINKDPNEVKTTYRTELSGKKLSIRADYSENYYTVELDEVVIGSIDSVDYLKKEYRIEVNDLSCLKILFALCIIVDFNIETLKNSAVKDMKNDD
ncbi:MAG: hypothetical protein IKN74_04255 [Clostridia bacterium]|nr:hypothetical protein [Clostridia bacterium]